MEFPASNRIIVLERRAYTLRGFNAGGTEDHTYETGEFGYSAEIYTVSHKLKTAIPGIIQLVVLPWYNDSDEAVRIQPQHVNNAVAEGHYVTIVLHCSAGHNRAWGCNFRRRTA